MLALLRQFIPSSIVRVAIAAGFIYAGLLSWALTDANGQSTTQSTTRSTTETEVLQEILPVQAEVLETILAAPYSELFTVTLSEGETGYGIKDRDFDPSFEDVGFYSLWGDVPDRELLQVAVLYCFQNPGLVDAELTEMILLNGDDTLLTVEQSLISTSAQVLEVLPERYEPGVYDDPFSDPYWGSVYTGGTGGGFNPIYLPAVDCSFGGGRFDLRPIQDTLRQLPEQTLEVTLRFSNGLEENWRLGEQTVEQIKRLPTLQSTEL